MRLYELGDYARIDLSEPLKRNFPPWSMHNRIGKIIKMAVHGPCCVPVYSMELMDGSIIHDVSGTKLKPVTSAEILDERKRVEGVLRFRPEPVMGLKMKAFVCDELTDEYPPDMWIKANPDLGKTVTYNAGRDLDHDWLDTNPPDLLYRQTIEALKTYNAGRDLDLNMIETLQKFEEKGKEKTNMPDLKVTIDAKNIGHAVCRVPKNGCSSVVETAKRLPPDPVPPKFTPKRILYNDPATIIFWQDGTKTVVKRSPNEKFNKYNAFCAALAKKMYGCNSRVNKIVDSGIVQNIKPDGKISDEAFKNLKRACSTARKKIAEYREAERQALIEKIMDLKKKQHLSNAKIAAKLDIPESTVRNLVQSAIERKEDK